MAGRRPGGWTYPPPQSRSTSRASKAASVLSNPDDWRDDEAIAGEDGPPQDEQEMLDPRVAGIRAADSFEGIWEFLYCR